MKAFERLRNNTHWHTDTGCISYVIGLVSGAAIVTIGLMVSRINHVRS